MADVKRILIVDDDPDCVEFVAEIVEDLGGCVSLTAADGEAGVNLARSEKPDLIVLDVNMPKKDGYTAFCELREDEATADIPVVMLTSLADMAGYMADGPQPRLFVAKPIAPEKLAAMIERVLGR